MAKQERINTDRFVRNYWKGPKGYGLWMFEDEDGQEILTHSGTYAAAKKVATAYANEHDITIYVCP